MAIRRVSYLMLMGLLCGLCACRGGSKAEPVVLTVAEKADHTIRALGAEVHPFFNSNLTKDNGAKAEDWERVVVKRVHDMGLQYFRVMVSPAFYEPVNDDSDPSHIAWENLTWDSDYMQSLCKVLDMAEQEGIMVNLTLWGAPQGHFLAGSHNGDWMVAPEDYDEWAENFSMLIQYLKKQRNYTCIKEITPVNEPNWAFIFYDRKPGPVEEYVKMCKVLDARFKADGIRDLVDFSLSDNTDRALTFLQTCTRELGAEADVFNSHTYRFGYETPNAVMRQWEADNVAQCKPLGKPHFVGEFGSNLTVGASRQRDMDVYERGVLMGRIVLNLLSSGATGVCYWHLDDQHLFDGRSYDAMQQLGLWKSTAREYAGDPLYARLTEDYEPRPVFYAYSLLTRFIRSGAELYPLAWDDDFRAGIALRNTDGTWTYVLVNQGTPTDVVIANDDAGSRGKYSVFRYVEEELPTGGRQIEARQTVRSSGSLRYSLPAHSVVVLVADASL